MADEFAGVARTFGHLKHLVDLGVVCIMILSIVVLFIEPFNLQRGDCDTWSEYVAGILGWSFWGAVAVTAAGFYG